MTSITCPICGMTSHNPNDVRERYCGHCHVFLDDEALLIEAMAREVGGKREMMQLNLQPISVVYLAGMLQLALRHPGTMTEARKIAESFIEGARAYYADCPAVLEVIARGER